MNVADAKYVSFASAGTRGIVYVGMLEALEEHVEATSGTSYDAWRASLCGAAGTSAGACAALALLLGLDREARRDTLHELSDVRTVVRCPDIALLLRHYGWEDGRAFKEMVQRILMRGGLSAESTLGDVKRLLRQDFVCVCTDLQTGRPMYLSAATAPTLRVYDAVYASCCVPFMFAPMHIQGTIVVDGCMSCDLPEIFDEDKTCFVFVHTPSQALRTTVPKKEGECSSASIESWVGFLHGIVRCSIEQQRHRVDRLLREHPDRCLALWLPQCVWDTPSFDINLRPQDCDAMLRSGYAATLNALLGKTLLQGVASLVRQYLQLAVVVVNDTGSEEQPPTASAPAPEACPRCA